MNKRLGFFILALVLIVVVIGLMKFQKYPARPDDLASQQSASHETHSNVTTPTRRVPSYQTAEASKTLGPTLAAEQFIGKTREAYKVAKDIPATLAQLPCYCECDRGFGHKSLHSCFEDDHASHCAVCVDEALLAYQLQTKQKMTPDHVREYIIEKYSETN